MSNVSILFFNMYSGKAPQGRHNSLAPIQTTGTRIRDFTKIQPLSFKKSNRYTNHSPGQTNLDGKALPEMEKPNICC